LGECFIIGWDIGEPLNRKFKIIELWIYCFIITWLSRMIEQGRLKYKEISIWIKKNFFVFLFYFIFNINFMWYFRFTSFSTN
jgi:hypothetical protein